MEFIEYQGYVYAGMEFITYKINIPYHVYEEDNELYLGLDKEWKYYGGDGNKENALTFSSGMPGFKITEDESLKEIDGEQYDEVFYQEQVRYTENIDEILADHKGSTFANDIELRHMRRASEMNIIFTFNDSVYETQEIAFISVLADRENDGYEVELLERREVQSGETYEFDLDTRGTNNIMVTLTRDSFGSGNTEGSSAKMVIRYR